MPPIVEEKKHDWVRESFWIYNVFHIFYIFSVEMFIFVHLLFIFCSSFVVVCIVLFLSR